MVLQNPDQSRGGRGLDVIPLTWVDKVFFVSQALRDEGYKDLAGRLIGDFHDRTLKQAHIYLSPIFFSRPNDSKILSAVYFVESLQKLNNSQLEQLGRNVLAHQIKMDQRCFPKIEIPVLAIPALQGLLANRHRQAQR